MYLQEHKVLLSGTPLQNNVEELFSLLNFLEPSQFHSSTDFLNEFGTLRTEEQVDKLKAVSKQCIEYHMILRLYFRSPHLLSAHIII